MESKKSISYYKEQAKDQLLGNYGIAIGSFVLIFACYYAINGLLAGAYTNSFASKAESNESMINMLLYADVKGTIASLIISLVAKIFFDILFVGFYYILMQIRDGKRPKASDVFYCFKNHPDKVIIISFIIEGIKVVTMLPAFALSMYIPEGQDINGLMFLLFIIAMLVGYGVQIFVSITYAFSYLVYIDKPELTAIECLKEGAEIMKGNRLRFFYMLLSLIGYFLLGIISFGIGFLYVISYKSMIEVCMYRDLKTKTTEAPAYD